MFGRDLLKKYGVDRPALYSRNSRDSCRLLQRHPFEDHRLSGSRPVTRKWIDSRMVEANWKMLVSELKFLSGEGATKSCGLALLNLIVPLFSNPGHEKTVDVL